MFEVLLSPEAQSFFAAAERSLARKRRDTIAALLAPRQADTATLLRAA